MKREKKLCAIFDIDGVIFDSREWGKYAPKEKDNREGWNEFARHVEVCKPNPSKIKLAKDLSKIIKIIFITSRENSPFLHEATVKQLNTHLGKDIKYTLFMRTYCDYRPAVEVKKEILQTVVLPNYTPILAVDDDIENVKMYQSFNILTDHYTALRNK